jgi:hypothetical protein
LQLPEAREAIGKAMPLLTGEFTSQELTVVGGLRVAGGLWHCRLTVRLEGNGRDTRLHRV